MGKKFHQLTDSKENDFVLLAIASHEPDYRACWILNKALGTSLVKVENLRHLDAQLGMEQEFSRFHFDHLDGLYQLFLISNHTANSFLIPAHKNVDFFLRISGEDKLKMRDFICLTLKKTDGILTVFELEKKDKRSILPFMF